MRNVFTSLLGTALVLSVGTAAQAQISFGPRIGANFADFGFRTESPLLPNVQMRLGAQVGVAANFGFGDNLALQPALLYSQKGYRVDLEYTDNGRTFTYEDKQRLSYLEIPVNFVYTSGGDEGLQVFAGPYVGFGLNGKSEEKSQTLINNTTVTTEREADTEFVDKVGNDNKKDYFRRLDVGATFGVGYKTGPIQVQLGYGLGVSNLTPNDKDNKEPEDTTYNRNLQLTLTYFFGAE